MYRQFSITLSLAMASALMATAQQPASERHPYEINQEAGPWAICVTCFFDNIENRRPSDPDYVPPTRMARSLAIEFVTELRRDYKLPAYIFNRGDEERRKEDERAQAEWRQRMALYEKSGVKPEDLPKKLWVKRLAHVQDQYVVLIGGYQDQEAARRSLTAIKNLGDPSKKFMSRLAGGINGSAGVDAPVNPFRTAFVVPNPAAPKVKQVAHQEEEQEVDLGQFNARNPYNLLKYPGKWTLVIKVYRGPTSVVGGTGGRNLMDRGPAGTNAGKMLEAMGKQAEQLAALLRNPQLNYESYVLHANNFSLVTVGIFDSERDPRMASAIGTLSKLKLDPEQLLNPPQPLRVPTKK